MLVRLITISVIIDAKLSLWISPYTTGFNRVAFMPTSIDIVEKIKDAVG
jgi:hypothetical protein